MKPFITYFMVAVFSVSAFAADEDVYTSDEILDAIEHLREARESGDIDFKLLSKDMMKYGLFGLGGGLIMAISGKGLVVVGGKKFATAGLKSMAGGVAIEASKKSISVVPATVVGKEVLKSGAKKFAGYAIAGVFVNWVGRKVFWISAAATGIGAAIYTVYAATEVFSTKPANAATNDYAEQILFSPAGFDRVLSLDNDELLAHHWSNPDFGNVVVNLSRTVLTD